MLVCSVRHEDRVFETYWTTGRGVEPMAGGYAGLQPNPYRANGRPISQWSRLEAGRSDDLSDAQTDTR